MSFVIVDCALPRIGCQKIGNLFRTFDCDLDGFKDQVCTSLISDDVRLVLSSHGCGNWKIASKADCSPAFKGLS